MEWAQPFQQTMDCDMIEAKFQWFLGGTLNASGKNFLLGTIPVIRQHIFGLYLTHSLRAVGGSENLGVPVLFGGHNLPPLVEIGLTDLPKFGGAMAPPAPPGTTGLQVCVQGGLRTREARPKKPG